MKKSKKSIRISKENRAGMRKYMVRYAPFAVIAAAATVFTSLLEVLKTDYLREIVDLAADGDIAAVPKVFLCALIVLGAILMCVFSSRYFAGRFAACAIRDIKRDSARRISQIPMEYMNTQRSGEILSKMSSDADAVQSFMENEFVKLLQLPFTIVFYSAYLLMLNPKLFAATFITLPILIPLGASFAIPFKVGSKKYMKYLGEVSNIVSDMVGGISVVKSYNIEDHLADKYNRGINRATDMALSNDRVQYIGTIFFSLARYIPVYICLLYGGYLCMGGSLTLGSLVAFSTLLGRAIGPLIQTSRMFFTFRAAAASAERLFSLLNEPVEKSGGMVESTLPSDKPAVEFRDVYFEYDEDKPVISGLNFSVKVGETVGFAGESGCGKSTLLGLVCGFYKPRSGQILIGGIDMNDWEINAVRNMISYVSQEAYLFPFSIYDNIAMGKPGATRDEVVAAAKAANAHDFILETEKGYDTRVGERGCRLSGGQVQRISIARAILKNAPILLLDEATSALDVKAEAEVQDALDNLSCGKTVMVVAHRLSTIKDADRIAVIGGGVVAECGTHGELIEKNGIYAMLNNLGGEAR